MASGKRSGKKYGAIMVSDLVPATVPDLAQYQEPDAGKKHGGTSVTRSGARVTHLYTNPEFD